MSIDQHAAFDCFLSVIYDLDTDDISRQVLQSTTTYMFEQSATMNLKTQLQTKLLESYT
jgi:hypothetical protein